MTENTYIELETQLTNNELDAYFAIIPNEEKEREFIIPIKYIYFDIVCRKGLGIESIEDLNGKEVVIMGGSRCDKILRENNINCSIFYYKTIEEGIKAINQGRHDAVLCPNMMGKYLLSEINESKNLITKQTHTEPYIAAIIVKDQDLYTHMSNTMNLLKKSGKYEEIYYKWFGEYEQMYPDKSLQHTIYIFTGLLILLLSFFLILIKKRSDIIHNKYLGMVRSVEKDYLELNTIYSNVSAGIEVYDKDGFLINCNDRAIEIFGITNKEILLSKRLNILDDIYYKSTIKSLDDLMVVHQITIEIGNKEIEEENQDFLKRIDSRIVTAIFSPMFNSKGEIEGFIITTTDETHEHKLNKKYLSLLKENQTLLETVPLGIVSYNLNGDVNYRNSHLSRIFNIDPEKYDSKDWNLFTHPHFCQDKYKNEILNCTETITGTFNVDNSNPRYLKRYSDILYNRTIQYFISPLKDDHGDDIGWVGAYSDITDIKNQMDEIARNKELLELALKSGNISSWRYTPNDKQFTSIQEHTETYSSVAQYNSSSKQLDEQYTLQRDAMIDNILSGKQYKDSKILKFTNPDTKETIYLDTHIVAETRNGKTIGIIGIQANITKDYSYRLAIEEINLKNKLAIRTGGLAQWDYDTETHIFYTKRESLKSNTLNQYTKDELISKSHPKDLEKVIAFFEKMDSGADENIFCEARILNTDTNKWRYYIASGSPFVKSTNGKVVQYTGFRKDNTTFENLNNEILKTNEIMRNVFDNLPCTLFIKNISDDFKYIIGNKQLCEVTGLKSENIIGFNDYQLFPDKAKDFREDDIKAIKRGSIISFHETVSWNNHPRILKTAKFPLTLSDGGQLLVGLALDVTELVEKNIELQKEKEKAECSDKLKSAFLANMSHEIRTPLNSIVGFSTLLVESEDKEEKKCFKDIITNNSNLLLRVINDILDLSKIESGSIDFNKELIDFSKVFDSCFRSFVEKGKEKGLNMIIDNPYDECIVLTDQNRVSQILHNFISNALKHTSNGFIKIGYSYEEKGLMIYVEDSGRGIPDDKKNLIFNRFEKLDDFSQGTGLGLSISKAIIDSIGGKIGFESEVGKGSTFWAWIPCEKEN